MKKTFLHGIALSALLLLGATGTANAQNSNTDVPPLNEELTAMTTDILAKQLTDPEDADKAFQKFFKQIRKDKEELTAAGTLFLSKNIYPYANMCAVEVYKLAPQYIPGLMLNGKVCMLRKDYGAAGQKFDEILLADSTNVEAMKLNAKVYKFVNPNVAKDMLLRIKRVEPNNAEADKELGDISYNLEDYKDAVKYYGSYYKTVTADKMDLRAMENYALSLFGTKNYDQALEISQQGYARNANDLVFRRMIFFCQYENFDYAKAAQSMAYLEDKQYADSVFIFLDYMYAGNEMQKIEDNVGAIKYFEKAVEKDSSRAVGLKSLSDAYRTAKMYTKAIPVYKKYLAILGDKQQPTDYFPLGVLYFSASQADSTGHKMEFVAEGDKVFTKVANDVKESYLGPFWRARINNVDDKTPNDSVKAFYEETLVRIGDKASAKSEKMECLQYLTWYEVQKDNSAEALKFANQMLAIDPNSAFAKQVKAFLEKK